MAAFGIEFISVFGLPPVEFVHMAADLGCTHISTGLQPMPGNPHGYAPWSLLNDGELRRSMQRALRERGVSVSLGEGFLIRPGTNISDRLAELEVMRELGAQRVNVVSLEPDANRLRDECATFVEMAAKIGCITELEFLPRTAVNTLSRALEVVRDVGSDTFKVLIDAMHFFRSGSTVADLARIDKNLIDYLQLCDVPLVSRFSDYADEARYERLPPGEGELPLQQLIDALPQVHVIGLEIPMRSKAEAGIGPLERLRDSVATARELLTRRPA